MSATSKTADLEQGTIHYRDVGEGSPVVFVHGFLVDGRLWERTAASLSAQARCITPDWPMGSHRSALAPEADLSPPGVAKIIADFLSALDLTDVTIAGNDSGGAISQILVTRHPERIGRLVLTNCDSFEHFPPFPFTAMPPIARIPGGMTALALPFRIGALRRAAYAPFAKHRIPDELTAAWIAPSMADAGVRRDLRKFTAGLHKRHTLEAAARLPSFDRPALLAWAPEDRFFTLDQAERLAQAFPDARIETIADAKTFVPLDQPERLAELIGAFVRGRAETEAAA
jgi:pimeloyl-ACP methyl ester carboxylesterase